MNAENADFIPFISENQRYSASKKILYGRETINKNADNRAKPRHQHKSAFLKKRPDGVKTTGLFFIAQFIY